MFEFERDRQTLGRECDIIRSATAPTLVIIEDYHRRYDIIEKLMLGGNPFIRFVLTSRTPIHLMEWSRLTSAFPVNAVSEIAIDQLKDDELVKLDKIFEQFGLLGPAAARNTPERLYRLKNNLKGEFRNILLDLLESPNIRRRISTILEEIAGKPGIVEIIIASLALRHIGASTNVDLLAELSGVSRLNRALLARDPNILEFVDVGHTDIVATSAIFATHALRSFWSSGRVVKLLSDMLQRALVLRYDGKEFGTIARDLMRYSKIDQLIPHENHDNQLIEYYEAIKNFEGCANNQFFWLQYAIARLIPKHYDLARRYLETAVALASKIPGFNTYQLDNTKARLLLMESIDNTDSDVAFTAFLDAHRILMVQMGQGTHGYYPYRVAALYHQFWSAHGRLWELDRKRILIAAAEAVQAKLKTVDRHLLNHADVRRCGAAMEAVLGGK